MRYLNPLLPLVDVADRFVPGATYQILFTICALVTASCLRVLRKDAPVVEAEAT